LENLDLNELKKTLREFAHARGWEQFHGPKNLSMALTVEASELLEIFQWMSEEESRSLVNEKNKTVNHIAEELSDIIIYAVRLSDVLGINLPTAIENKIKKNSLKYPIKEDL